VCVKGERMKEIKDGYLRVTEVLKPFVSFDHINPVVLQKACERGTRVHRYAELYAKGEYFPEPEPELAGYVKSFTRWFDEMVEEVLYLELRLYDDNLRITGQVDLIARLRGCSDSSVVIDYKTAANASLSWNLQLAAYKHLVIGYEGLYPHRRIALQLFKDGSFPKIIEYTSPQDWEIYKGILAAVRFFDV